MGFWWIAYGMKEREGSRMSPRFPYIWHFSRPDTWLQAVSRPSEGDGRWLSPNMELISEYSNPVVGRIGKNQKAPQFKHHQIIGCLIKTTCQIPQSKVQTQKQSEGPKESMEIPFFQWGSKTTFEFATIETTFRLMMIPIRSTCFKSP